MSGPMEPPRVWGLTAIPHASTILIVDDDEGIRRLLTSWVSMQGHYAVTAAGADAALEIMRSIPVDVAVCDIMMPDRDGIWLIDQLRRDYPQTAVVIATGLDEMDPAVTLSSRVAAYVTKPLEQDTFGAALNVALALQGRP